MQDATTNVTSNYDAHEAAGRATSIMSLLLPDLRLFIKRCVTKHCDNEPAAAATTTPTSKKKKKVAPRPGLSAEATMFMRTIASGSTELDFAAGLKFIDQHWKLVFEPQVGMYASELKSSISTALRSRNKVAHQAVLSSAESDSCIDALSDLTVLLCAERATKHRIRALVNPKICSDNVSALQQSLDAFTVKNLEHAEAVSSWLRSIQDATKKQAVGLENDSYHLDWIVHTIENQERLIEKDRLQLRAIVQALTRQAQSVAEVHEQGRWLADALKPSRGWRSDNLLDKLLRFATEHKKLAEYRENHTIKLIDRLKALSLQVQDNARAVQNKLWWSKFQFLVWFFVAFTVTQFMMLSFHYEIVGFRAHQKLRDSVSSATPALVPRKHCQRHGLVYQ